jgi:hypothetical protein
MKWHISHRLTFFVVWRVAVSSRVVLFPDVVIRCPSDNHNSIPDDSRLFIEVLVDDNKVKMTEQFAKDSTGSSWRLNENIAL